MSALAVLGLLHRGVERAAPCPKAAPQFRKFLIHGPPCNRQHRTVSLQDCMRVTFLTTCLHIITIKSAVSSLVLETGGRELSQPTQTKVPKVTCQT